ncbi:hypothetical protein Rsub_01101 [Raphidocelis subcapitata]|uniref:Uncharacterized protein n=1 Tax=Raphidocelis subcapitata TaxID=307507 RepID=A0A2V0NML7_9CHLO|nr:hypothetical protein Rsub_01101 [Raphidocelis subcapitata]|eukprot:GBF88389.1 hypothetical protein Rsub_01101 [Raphidocelis subcapitata]
MVFGSDIAIVVRARRGRNVLVQSHGLEMRAVVTAAHEVSAALEGDLSSAMELVDAGVGVGSQGSAPLACGRLHVVGNRYDAVYRAVGSVLIIAITRAGANPFASLNLVTAVTRMLCAECKTVDVSPARLLKRYAQVYTSVDLLISRGTLDIVRALTDAALALEALGPAGARARKIKALQDKAAGAVAAQQGKQVTRRLPDARQRDGRFSFSTPAELSAISVPVPQFPLPPLPGPDRPPPKAVVEDKLLEVQLVEAQPEAKPEAEVEPQPINIVLAPKGPALRLRETWLAECVGSRVARAGLSGAVAWASQEVKSLSASVPFRLAVPDFAERSVKHAISCARVAAGATKPGPEYASFVADTLSGHPASTAVLSYGLPATWGGVPPVLARLTAGIVPLPRKQWAAAAATAEGKQQEQQHQKEGAKPSKKKKSKGGKGSEPQTPTQQPTPRASDAGRQQQQQQDAATGAPADAAAPSGPPVAVLVTVNFSLPSEFPLKPRDLVIELQVPPELGAPRRVSGPAAAEWCPARGCLRWTLGGVYAGFRGAAAAAFRAEAGASAALALLPALRALVGVRGEPGETLTGLQLEQATSTAERGGLQTHPETSEWAGFVLARPALYEGGEFAAVEAPWGPEEAAAPLDEPAAAAAAAAAAEAAAEKGEEGGGAAGAAAPAAAGVVAGAVAGAAAAAAAAEAEASPAPPTPAAEDGGAAEEDPPSQQGVEAAQPSVAAAIASELAEATAAPAAEAEVEANAEAEAGPALPPAEAEAEAGPASPAAVEGEGAGDAPGAVAEGGGSADAGGEAGEGGGADAADESVAAKAGDASDLL